MKKIKTLFAALALISIALPSHAQYAERKAQEDSMRLKGPGLHLSGGVRMLKAPDYDTIYGVGLGLKISPFGLMFGAGSPTYISFLAGGVHYFGIENRVAFLVSPIIFNHISGVGLSADWYATRHDRVGGNVGFSLNFDVLQLAQFAGGFVK